MMLMRLLAILLMCLAPVVAHAQTFPALTGRVVDNADLLSPQEEAALDAKLAALETTTTRQLVVATLPDLQGYEIEEYGYQLARAWGIGQADGSTTQEANNGALLIVAPNDRKVRIEVGYGLEGILTDALSSVVIQQNILPNFRNGDFPGGIDAGVDALVSQLKLPEDQARAIAQRAATQQKKQRSSGNNGALIFWLFIFFFFILPIFFSGRKGGKRYRGGAGPIVIWGPSSGGFGGSSSGGFGGGGFGGGFGGGGGSFGGGGASGGW